MIAGARSLGDLLTVSVNLQDQAEFANQTTLSRTTANGLTIPNTTTMGAALSRIFPLLNTTSPVINTSGNDSTAGQGDIILVVNNQKIARTSDLDKATREAARIWRITLVRGGQQINVTLGG